MQSTRVEYLTVPHCNSNIRHAWNFSANEHSSLFYRAVGDEEKKLNDIDQKKLFPPKSADTESVGNPEMDDIDGISDVDDDEIEIKSDSPTIRVS